MKKEEAWSYQFLQHLNYLSFKFCKCVFMDVVLLA